MMSFQDNALDIVVTDDLLHFMKLRFDAVVSDQSYYRIFAVPEELNREAIDTRDAAIRETMFNPPDRRYGNFGVTGILEREMSASTEGIQGPNITGGEIILLRNGFLEVRCPLRDTQFQWRNIESGLGTEWIFPYVVCEFPVTFLKLVQSIYEASGIDTNFIIEQSYHNLKGFMLVGGNPSNVGFGTFRDERRVYAYSTPIVSKRRIDRNFNPEHVAYDLVRDVYDVFGFGAQWIPAYDREGNFMLD